MYNDTRRHFPTKSVRNPEAKDINATTKSVRNPRAKDINAIIDGFLHPGFQKSQGRPVRVIPPTSIVWHDGTSQYRFLEKNGAGSASCGLCASNFARQVFEKYTSGTMNQDLFRWLLTKDCTMKITEIAQHYKKNVFLEVSNIVGAPSYPRFQDGIFYWTEDAVPGLPYFNEVLDTTASNPVDSLLCTYNSFADILQRMDDIDGISATLITAPPEIVAAMKIPMDGAHNGKIFVVFDSHGYDPFCPGGSGMIICPTLEAAARFLATRFPASHSLEIGASFVAPKVLDINEKSVQQKSLESSMRILDLEVDLSEVKAGIARDKSSLRNRGATGSQRDEMRQRIEHLKMSDPNLLVEFNTARRRIKELEQESREAKDAQERHIAEKKIMQQRIVEERRKTEKARRAVEEVRHAADDKVNAMQDRLIENERVIQDLEQKLWALEHNASVSGIRNPGRLVRFDGMANHDPRRHVYRRELNNYSAITPHPQLIQVVRGRDTQHAQQ